MARRYIVFKSEGAPVRGDQCTTAWPSSVTSSVVLSGEYEGYYYNIMVMEGAGIDEWLAENEGKVTEVSKKEANELGRAIIPAGTTVTVTEIDEGREVVKTYEATQFNVDNPGGLWVVKE